MAKVINPEDASITVSKTNVADASKVVFWLPCDETGTITALVDAVSGGTVTIPSSVAASGGVAIPNVNNAAFSGTLPALANDFALLIVANYNPTVASSIGYGTGAQKIIASSGDSGISGASGTDALDAAIISGGIHKVLIYTDTDGDAYLYQGAQGAVLVNTLNPVSAAGVVTPSANELNFSAFAGTNTVYGLAVIDLATDALPADIVVWADWTMEQWAANNKVLPLRYTEL